MLAAKAGSNRLTANIVCRCRRRLAVSIVRTGSRPGGCPGPMRRSWLRRNRLLSPPMLLIGRGRASSFRIKKTKSLHFFGEAPERRPWAIKRENRPAAFAGRSICLSDGIHAVPTQASILSRSFLPSGTRQRVNTRSRPGHSVRRSRANNVTRYIKALAAHLSEQTGVQVEALCCT